MMNKASLAVLTALSIVVPVTAQQEETRKQETTASTPTLEEMKIPADVAAPVDPKAYKIGAEDVLEIVVWQQPQLSARVQVRPDGMITVPLIGDVLVNGATPEQLAGKLKEKLSELVNDPLVNVAVASVRSKKYGLTGNGVARTGEFPLVVPTTIMDALVRAGGFTEFANKKKVVILRGKERFTFNYNDYVKGKNTDKNIYLENGDLVIVD